MALLCAGAIGNLIDRLALGRVTDMFWLRFIDFPVFNVADVCITIAGVLLGLSVVAELFQRHPHHHPSPEGDLHPHNTGDSWEGADQDQDPGPEPATQPETRDSGPA
jgi:signal peptidase II